MEFFRPLRIKFLLFVFLLVFAVILLLAGSTGWYSLKHSKTSSPPSAPKICAGRQVDTTQWQTYGNPKYWYSVKYPSDWHIVKELSRPDGIIFSSPPEPSATIARPGHPSTGVSPALVGIHILETVNPSSYILESYRPFYAREIIQKDGKTYIVLASSYEEGGVISDKMGNPRTLAIEVFCGMLSTFHFAE